MKSLIRHPLYLVALLLYSLLSCAQAADNDRFLVRDNEGFTTSLPNISDSTVTQHLTALQQDLETKLTHVKQEVERKSFKAVDTLVTVFMPGGLLYAKLRLDAFKHSQEKFNRVSDELAEISGELVAFQADNGGLLIATVE